MFKKFSKVKVCCGIVLSALIVGANAFNIGGFSAMADDVDTVSYLHQLNSSDDIGIYSYSQKNSDNINELLKKDKGVIYVKDSADIAVNAAQTASDEDEAISAVSYGEYYYMDGGKVCSSEFFGTQYTNQEQLSNLVEVVKDCINTASDSGVSVCSANTSSPIGIGDAWTPISTVRTPLSMDYNDEHYGDYIEWKTSYKYKGYNATYYAVTRDGYIMPNQSETKFRTKSITLRMKIYQGADGCDCHVYDYIPKQVGASYTLSESMGAELSADGASVSIGISYTHTVKTPEVQSLGNMSQDIVKIKYSYLHYDSMLFNQDFVKYCRAETVQSVSYIIRDVTSHYNRMLKEATDIEIFNTSTFKAQTFSFAGTNSLK